MEQVYDITLTVDREFHKNKAVTISITGFSQNKETKRMLSEIEGQWQLDDNNNITYKRVVEIDGMTKDELFNRASNYFVYNYGDANSVIQTKDKENGTIVGKGKYGKVHIGIGLVTTTVSTWHILRVDTKDGKARIILTLTDYDKVVSGGSSPDSYSTISIVNEFPINPKGMFKNVMGKAFYKSHMRAMATLDDLEKALKEGNTDETIENNDDW